MFGQCTRYSQCSLYHFVLIVDLSHADISTNMTRCQKLTILDLSSNNLDKVPECLASLMNLQQLYLNDTFIDFLPANFGRLQNLKILELRDNMLNKLPKSLRRLNQLQRLDLSNNELTEIVSKL